MALEDAISSLALFLLVIPGFVTAFFGWKIHEALVELAGFIVGIIFGTVVSIGIFLGEGARAANGDFGLLFLILILLFGVGGAQFFKAMERLAVAVPGFLLGSLLGVLASQGSIGDIFAPIPLIFGLAVGLLFWWGYVAAIIIYTAFFGAFLVTFGSLIWNGQWYGLFDTARLFSGSFWLIFLTGGAVQAGVVAKFKQLSMPGDESITDSNVAALISDARRRTGDGPSFKELVSDADEAADRDCPKCGYASMPGDSYCQSCGAALLHCQSCGGIGLGDWEFCQHCGTTIT